MHKNIEILQLDGIYSLYNIVLPDGSLPRLRELSTSSEDFAIAIMSCPCPPGSDSSPSLETSPPPRPLEILRGIGITGAADQELFNNMRLYAIKRLELVGYSEFDDLKRLIPCVPSIVWLDVGKKLGWAGSVADMRNTKGASAIVRRFLLYSRYLIF